MQMKHKAGTPESQWEPDPDEADMRPLSEANKRPTQKVSLGKRKQASSAHPNQRFVPDDVTSKDIVELVVGVVSTKAQYLVH